MGIERNPLAGFESQTELATFVASSAAAGYPASNLNILPLNKVWRSADGSLGAVADSVITWTYEDGLDQGARLFSLVRHNLSLAATFRLQLYSDTALTTEVFDSDAADLIGGNEIWPPVYGDDELEWSDNNWYTGKYTARQIAGRTWTRVIDVGAVKLHKGGKLTITDPDNADLHHQAGFLDISRSHQFTRGISLGSSRGPTTNEVTTQSDGGVFYTSDGAVKRAFRGTFQNLPRAEAQNILGEMKTRYTKKRPFIWHPFPADPKTWLINSMFCRFNDLDLGQFAQQIHDSEPVSLIEE